MLVTLILCTLRNAKVVAYHSPSIVELGEVIDKPSRVESDINTGRLSVQVTKGNLLIEVWLWTNRLTKFIL